MAMNRPAAWLVAYDIADPRRLRRVHRAMREHGVPLQYSVFLVEKTPAQVQHLRDELEECIHPRWDDIRIYRLPRRPSLETLGRKALPAGVDLIDSSLACWLQGKAG